MYNSVKVGLRHQGSLKYLSKAVYRCVSERVLDVSLGFSSGPNRPATQFTQFCTSFTKFAKFCACSIAMFSTRQADAALQGAKRRHLVGFGRFRALWISSWRSASPYCFRNVRKLSEAISLNLPKPQYMRSLEIVSSKPRS